MQNAPGTNWGVLFRAEWPMHQRQLHGTPSALFGQAEGKPMWEKLYKKVEDKATEFALAAVIGGAVVIYLEWKKMPVLTATIFGSLIVIAVFLAIVVVRRERSRVPVPSNAQLLFDELSKIPESPTANESEEWDKWTQQIHMLLRGLGERRAASVLLSTLESVKSSKPDNCREVAACHLRGLAAKFMRPAN